MTSVTSVALIAQDQLYREGIAKIIHGNKFELVRVSESADELIKKSEGETIDLIVVDYLNQSEMVPALIRKLRNNFPARRIVILAAKSDVRTLLDAFNAGADGGIHRGVSSSAFLESLSLIITGERVYSANLLTCVMNGRHSKHANEETPSNNKILEKFSAREKDVVRYLCRGFSNKEIGIALGIADSSVKVHIRRICRLLNAKNRTQAALYLHKEFELQIEEDQSNLEMIPKKTLPNENVIHM